MRTLIYRIVQIILLLNVTFSCLAVINTTDLIKDTTDIEGGVSYGDTNYCLY